jgi:hypothetical protein
VHGPDDLGHPRILLARRDIPVRTRAGTDAGPDSIQPLREAAEVTGRIAFFNELVDIVVDGVRLERPTTPWSRR